MNKENLMEIMNEKYLTKKDILHEASPSLYIHMIFFMLSIFLTIIGLILLMFHHLPLWGSLLYCMMLLAFSVFGSGFFFDLMLIVKLHNDDFSIKIDTVKNLRMRDDDKQYCYLIFEKNGRARVSYDLYSKAQIGDKYYIVDTQDKVLYFPCKEYVLDKELAINEQLK